MERPAVKLLSHTVPWCLACRTAPVGELLATRGADVLVDTQLNPAGSSLTVIMN